MCNVLQWLKSFLPAAALLLLAAALRGWAGSGAGSGGRTAGGLNEPLPALLEGSTAAAGGPPTALACPFHNREDFVERGTLDPRRRWVALTAEQLSTAEARNPFTGCSLPRFTKSLHVVFPDYVDRTRNTSSGLGSLTLQILDVVRWALVHGCGARFPDPVQWT